MLLFGLLLWQNPVLAAEEWLEGGFGSGRWRWARLARDLCQLVGIQVVWVCWVCLMDGQHVVKIRRRADLQFGGGAGGGGSANDTAEYYRQVAGEENYNEDKDNDSTASPVFLKDDYPPHHPRSESFIDFILPKVLYGVLSLLVGIFLALLRHPTMVRLDQSGWLDGRLEVRALVEMNDRSIDHHKPHLHGTGEPMSARNLTCSED